MLVPNFKMWIGVVEDRIDPEQIGRYKVRILGYHTANRETLPTKDLPWATPVMPLTSASLSGIGETPGLINGATVVGFFADGDDEQQPVILGSLPGVPLDKISDPKIGFSDPKGKYPRSGEEGYNDVGESDISRLARGPAAETHASLLEKRRTRMRAIPTAKAPDISSTAEKIQGADYTGAEWDEPHARFGTTDQGTYTQPGEVPTFEDGTTSVYPFNHVRETETGHVFEVDDTPKNGRIHEYHNSGTYREIQSDGTRVTKIVSRDVEIVMQGKDVYITGGCNVTIKGDCKLLVEGDMYEEIRMVRDANGKPTGKGGNKFTHIEGSRHTKIQGNDILEVNSGMSTNVGESQAGSYSLRIAGSYTNHVTGDHNTEVGGGTSHLGISTISINSQKGSVVIKGVVTSITGVTAGIWKGGTYGSIHASNLDVTASLSQKIACAANQLLEAGAMQTISAVGLQRYTAGVRQITAPITSHLGMYNVTGNILGTAVNTITGIGLGTHSHISSAPGTPTPKPPIP